MTRKDFLSKVPLGAAFAFTAFCAGGCTKQTLKEAVNENTSLPTDGLPNPFDKPVDFTIDLTTNEYSNLTTPGSYAFFEDVIIVFSEKQEYLAATKICSDEALPRMIWENGEYLCEEHGATFDQNGDGTTTYNNLGSKGIAAYQVELNGSLLRVFS